MMHDRPVSTAQPRRKRVRGIAPLRWAPSGLVMAKGIIPPPEEGVKLVTPAIPRNAGHGTSRIERHGAGGLMYDVTLGISTGGRPLPDEPRDPDDHEAHSDVPGGLASRVLLSSSEPFTGWRSRLRFLTFATSPPCERHIM